MPNIEISRPDIREFAVTIYGDTPLIVNQFGEKARRAMLDAMTKKTKTKKREDKNPKAEYESSFYYCADKKTYGFPALCLKQAIVSACRQVDGIAMTNAKQMLYVKGDNDGMIEIKYEKVSMREDRVRVRSGSFDLRYRPQFDGWSMTFFIEYNAEMTSAEQIINLLDRAGFGNGLGEWRPERGGEMGRFHVK